MKAIHFVTSEKKSASINVWCPLASHKSAGLVAVQLKSRHGIVTDHLTPAQARQLSAFLLEAASRSEEIGAT